MKVVGSSIAVAIVGLALLGIFTNFVANEASLKYFIFGGLGFSIIVLVFILTRLLKEGSAYTERMQNQGKSPLMGIVAITIFVPAMSVVASYKGLPVALNYVFGSQGEVLVTVQSRPAGHYSKRCSGRVNLQGYSYFTNDRVCGIREGDWRKLTPGSKLILLGKKSIFGIQYNRYKS